MLPLTKLTRITTILSILLISFFMVSAALAGAAGTGGSSLFSQDIKQREGLDPAIVMTKTVSATPGVCGPGSALSVVPGTDVHYCYEVTNTGQVTVTKHTLEDDQLGLLLDDAFFVLPPGESYTFSTTVEVTDDVTNFAVWTADDGFGTADEASDSATVTTFDPEIVLSKTANTTPGICPGGNSIQVIPGTPVNYCYEVTNTGLVTLTMHTLTDNKLGLLIPLNTAILLPPAASFTFSTTEVITQSVVNIGIWTADDDFGHLTGDNDSATVTVLMPTIVLTKTVSAVPGICAPTDVVTVTAGSSVTYCYEIENTGLVTVTGHSLFDDVLGALFTDTLTTVGPGETMAYSTTVPVNLDTINIATWTAEEPFGNQTQANDTAAVFVTTPGLELVKTVTVDLESCPGTNTETVVPNTMVTYCFELKNTGTTTLTTHTLVDDQLGVLLFDAAIVIGPGESHTLSANGLITQAVTNLATWTATDTFDNELQTSDTASVQITGVEVDLVKTVGTSLTGCSTFSEISVVAGTTVSYCFKITNTGLVTLTTHTLVDSQLGLLLNGVTIVVPPGETFTLTETAVVNSSVTNNANWTAIDTYGNTASSSDSATVNIVAAGILVSPNSITVSQPVDQITMATLYITNTGTTGLSWSSEENQVPGNADLESSGGLGDEIFRLNLGAALGNEVLLGVEFDGSSFWVTAGGVADPAEPNLLYEFDRSGALLNTYTNTIDTAGFGWRDLAFDGSKLYASASAVIDEIDPADGQPTGFTIPSPVNPARAIAYDPATDHFWVANFNSQIYEIGRDGLVINSFPNIGSPIYGLAWDDVSPGGPYLWAWTAANPPEAIQIDPVTGLPTGTSFTGESVAGGTGGGGATITTDLYPDRLVLIGMHQAGPDVVIGYDLGVETGICSANEVSWLSLTPGGGIITPGNGIEAIVEFDSTGLAPGIYDGHLCITSSDTNNPLVLVTVRMIVGFENRIFLPVIFRDP